MHISQTELMQRINSAKQTVEVGGFYAHYKNPDLAYKVVDIAITEADDSPCVIYRAEYGEKITFVRPLASWLDTVERDGEAVPRFTKIKG